MLQQVITKFEYKQKELFHSLQFKMDPNQGKQENKQDVEGAEKFVVTPWTISNSENKEMDYERLLNKFGCFPVDQKIIERIEKLSGKPAHRLIRRGIFYAHRDLNVILDAYENHKDPQVPPFYLFTGRGPSSEAIHLGHILPFIFNKYLQESFNVPFVIQMSDDEKYFFKEGEDISDFTEMAYENIKDILALGFDPEKTFIFIDSQYMGNLYPNVCRFLKNTNVNTLKSIFGSELADNCGRITYTCVEAAPCLSSCFPHIFGDKNYPCLIPCGIDQDPYFRMARDVCPKLKAPKPAGFYSKFFPALQGFTSKMSSTNPNSGIFMTDTAEEIETKIKKYAFSGGQATKEDQIKYGANLEIDIPYQYLRFFMEDDKELEEIGEKYKSGKMMTDEIKKILSKVLTTFILDHQERRKNISNEDVKKFLSQHKRKFN